MPRPNLNPGVPLGTGRLGLSGGKILNRAAFNAAPNGQQGASGAMCCADSARSRRISVCSACLASANALEPAVPDRRATVDPAGGEYAVLAGWGRASLAWTDQEVCPTELCYGRTQLSPA